MIAETVLFLLKPNSGTKALKILQGAITPALVRLPGFEGAFLFLSFQKREAAFVSLWDEKRRDQDSLADLQVRMALAPILEGFPSTHRSALSGLALERIRALAPGESPKATGAEVRFGCVSPQSLERIKAISRVPLHYFGAQSQQVSPVL